VKLPYAEDMNYWQSSKTAPDTWIEKAKAEIIRAGGKVLGEGFVSEGTTGNAAYMLMFGFGLDSFKAVWPVLPTRSGKYQSSAKTQAATMLYHDVKARCVAAKVLGTRAAFFNWFVLPTGQTASEAAAPDLVRMIPRILAGPPTGQLQIVEGEFVED
jgi:hypothetical protein